MPRRNGCVLLVACCALAAVAQARPSLQVRLLQEITSYRSTPGTPFRAVVTAPFIRGERVQLPPGAVVHGKVRSAKSVGIGLVRERAAIGLEFIEYELPDGRRFPLNAKLRRVDNAREVVTPTGEIKGILAASNPQSLINGLWRMPNPSLLHRSFIGLTGASGRIWTEYSMGPLGAVLLLSMRFALFRMPEPEIRLPAGTELSLSVLELAGDAPTFDVPPGATVQAALAGWLSQQPYSVARPSGRISGDIVNVAMVGSRQQLLQAFRAAGWAEAERMTGRSLSRAYHAYTNQSGYPTAPASKLLYGGNEPEFVMQKSFNTLAKRHHIRLWQSEFEGQEVWLGAATHDIGIAFQPSGLSFSHRIHPAVDFERSKVTNDLAFAGCLESAGFVERPGAARTGEEVGGTISDGRLAVLNLRECADLTVPNEPMKQPQPRLMRMARRTVLEGRNYVLRGNAYYWAYRALRWRPADQAKGIGVDE